MELFLRACLGARLLPQSYQYPNLSEGADRVGGQLRGDKECRFSGVTKSGSLEEGAGKRCSECVNKVRAGTSGGESWCCGLCLLLLLGGELRVRRFVVLRCVVAWSIS